MKKSILLLSAAMLCLSANAKEFGKGDVVVDLGVGTGFMHGTESELIKGELQSDKVNKMTYNQRLGFEFGVLDFSDKSSLGIGFNINNAISSKFNSRASGSYNYAYTVTTYEHGRRGWQISSRDETYRSGTGSSNAKNQYIDLNVMAKVAYHHQFLDKLDTYVAVGFGVARVHKNISDFTDKEGFFHVKNPLDRNASTYYPQFVYEFNDLDHVKWENGTNSGRFVAGCYLGARYYLSKNWGINLDLGLTSISFAPGANDYSLCVIGASYKF